ncbi:MAG: c-type cytochrome [Chitinophaga sp.]|uniref:c-type cytochrome n=1 Tax=Chitinophaga sp. TaxID=1869181 RepID=UPI001B2845FD|nr:c-type cytochrome [Chitinophaga sp.]MBO9729587.1 c-type cytochrome [Chitinophaga sp.]
MRPCLFILLPFFGWMTCNSCQTAPSTPAITPERKDSIPIKLITGFNEGKVLFQQYCSSCHRPPVKQGHHNETLVGIFDRMPAPSTQYFIRYIQDSKALERAGDTYALVVAREWHYTGAHHFKDSITAEAMRSLIVYLRVTGSR